MARSKLLKHFEFGIRRVLYGVLRAFIRNKPVSLPLNPDKIQKILIVRHDRLGDMVVTTPVFQLLRERLPQAEIHVLCSPRNIGLLAEDGRITSRLQYDGSFRSLFSLIRGIRRKKFDAMFCLVFHKMTGMGIFANLIGGVAIPKITIEHDTRGSYYGLWFNAQVALARDRETMAELQCRLVCATFGWEYQSSLVQYHIQHSPAHETFAETLWKTYNLDNQDVLFYNLSAGKTFCQWSESRNEEFLALFHKRFPEYFVLINAAPAERKQAEQLHIRFPDFVRLIPATADILNVCAVIRRTTLAFTPDTSFVHITSAYKKPVFILYSRFAYSVEWHPFLSPFQSAISEEATPVESLLPQTVMQKFEKFLRTI